MPGAGGWTFEASLAAFLALAALSQAAAALSRGRVSLPLALGVLCIAGFALGALPTDLAARSRMKEVGVIAFNVLIVHGGTALGSGLGRDGRKAAVVASGSAAALLAILGGGLVVLGYPHEALSAMGPALGGGAACAIASNAVSRRQPELAVLPWLVFMLQGCFGLPVLSWALRRERDRMDRMDRTDATGGARRILEKTDPPAAGPAIFERMPRRARGSAYYLGGLMLAAWISRVLHGLVLAKLGVHPALGALALGVLLSRLGLLEREPLRYSDSFGLLMLGLMSLMADTLAVSGLGGLLRYIPLAALVCGIATAVLTLSGAAFGLLAGVGTWRGIAAALCAQAGAPCYAETARAILGSAGTQVPELRDGREAFFGFLDDSHAIAANLAAVFLASLAGGLPGLG